MKIIFFLIFALNLLYANTVINFEKGWNLVGIPQTLSTMKLFDTKKVSVVWAYNSQKQSWEGYSSDDDVTTKIVDKNISILNTLEPYQAVWVLSNESWDLTLNNENVTDTPANNKIVLKKGWNLVTLPNKAVVSKDFFGNAIVWKYKDEWSVNDSSLDFPTIENIRESEGFWVNSKEDIELDMGEELSKLRTFDSKEEMLEYIREMQKSNRYRRNYEYYGTSSDDIEEEDDDDDGSADSVEIANDTLTSVPSEKSSDVDATTTNTQENDVDEADILKHDGQYIFSVDNSKKEIFITSFVNVADKNYTAINTIKIEDDSIIDMYLQSNRLVVLTNDYGNDHYYYKEDTRDEISSVNVTIYDISNIFEIIKLIQYEVDGSYNTSRLVDVNLLFITNFDPCVKKKYAKIYAEGVCLTVDKKKSFISCETQVSENEDNYLKQEICTKGEDFELYHDNNCRQYNYDPNGSVWKYNYDVPYTEHENLLPYMKLNAVVSELIEPSKFYAPKKLDQSANITTISSFDIINAIYIESISVLGDMHTEYASTNSFYLISRSYPQYYNYFNYKRRQMIYKFSLGEKLEYEARGFVDGSMLNQFSMSEQDDYLRVATTQGDSWSEDGTNNSVFVLQAEDKNLIVQSVLSNLGKEGETIKAVRFMGNRGFVVTFRTTDPLYTLDLSDPLNPLKVGELSIPGYSSYLHIVDENRVLSIGRDNTLQLQLFDITDFANPLLVDKVLVGDTDNSYYTYSSAEYNHKAFIYRPSDMMFALPYTNNNYSGASNDNFGVYQVNGMKIENIKILTIQYDENYSGNYNSRGLIFDLNNTIYGTVFEGSNIFSDIIIKEGE